MCIILTIKNEYIFCFRDQSCNKIKRMVAQAAFEVHNSSIIVQGAGGAEATTTDNTLPDEKDSSDNSVTPKRKSLFGYCETSKVFSKKIRVDIMDDINEEIMLFLKDQNNQSDLIFVKKNHFPYLHSLALKILCIPATAAPAERVFSRSGLLMRPHRSRLSKDMLSKLTLIKCNFDLLD